MTAPKTIAAALQPHTPSGVSAAPPPGTTLPVPATGPVAPPTPGGAAGPDPQAEVERAPRSAPPGAVAGLTTAGPATGGVSGAVGAGPHRTGEVSPAVEGKGAGPTSRHSTTYEHGTRNRYLHGGCRCTPCRKANTRHQNRRRMAINNGTHVGLVDAEPVRDHVLALKQAGLCYQRVAQLAGVNRETVNRLLYGSTGQQPTQRMKKANADAILAVQAWQLADGGWTPAAGTRRRLQALALAGWPGRVLAGRLQISHRQFMFIASGRAERVTVSTARKCRRIYDELWKTDPASAGVRAQSISQAKKAAAAKGWAPVGAWDDDTIDDPAATPDLGAKVNRSVALAENSEELLRLGYTIEQAAERLGVSRNYLDTARARTARGVAAHA